MNIAFIALVVVDVVVALKLSVSDKVADKKWLTKCLRVDLIGVVLYLGPPYEFSV